jgi:hypothetical protein
LKKLIWFLGIVVLLVLTGCNSSNIDQAKGYQEPYFCLYIPSYHFYVQTVNSINPENCYATRNKQPKLIELENVKEAIQKNISDGSQAMKQYYEENPDSGDCEIAMEPQTIYCLPDRSQCLLINNNICEVYNITQK